MGRVGMRQSGSPMTPGVLAMTLCCGTVVPPRVWQMLRRLRAGAGGYRGAKHPFTVFTAGLQLIYSEFYSLFTVLFTAP